MQALAGYKTYLVAAAMIVYAALSYFHPGNVVPAMDLDGAMKIVFAALALMGIRSGVTTEISKLLAALGVNVTDGNASTPSKVAAQAVSVARKVAPLVLVMFCLSLTLTACASAPTLSPQQTLQAVEGGFALAEATYDAICSVNAPPSFCTNPADVAAYGKAKVALEAAFQTAQAAISASGGLDSASIDALLQAVSQDWAAYNQIVNTVQQKNAARLGVAYHPIPL